MWILRTKRLFCLLAICACALLLCPCKTQALELGNCKSALGMQSREISDEDLSASSYFDLGSVGPQNARIRMELNGGAWCPKQLISKEVYEYLEIDLGQLKVVTAVETQGRFGNGQGQEYAEAYFLHYWRPGFQEWKQFKNQTGDGLFRGNVNTYTEVKHEVNPPVVASKIRFVPYSQHPRTVCMRVELYGCHYKEGLVSYSMPQGEKRGTEIDLYDMTYDGVEENRYLSGGLGQLTDGQKGHDNFRLDSSGFGKGYEWVGWRNDSSHLRPLELIFEFEQVRNFSAAYFYANNLFSKDVQVFVAAKIWFSIGGEFYNGEPVVFDYMPDTMIENARNVTIKLNHRVGRFLKFQLTFGAKWMMISEVSFDSFVSSGNFSEETEHIPQPVKPGVKYLPDGSSDDEVSTAMSEDALSNQYIGLIIGVLAAVILLLVLIIFLIMARNRRRKQGNNHTVLKPMEKRVTINMKVPNDCHLNVCVSPDPSVSTSSTVPRLTSASISHPIPISNSGVVLNACPTKPLPNAKSPHTALVHGRKTALPPSTPPPPPPSLTSKPTPSPRLRYNYNNIVDKSGKNNMKNNERGKNIVVDHWAKSNDPSAPDYETLLTPYKFKVRNDIYM